MGTLECTNITVRPPNTATMELNRKSLQISRCNRRIADLGGVDPDADQDPFKKGSGSYLINPYLPFSVYKLMLKKY